MRSWRTADFTSSCRRRTRSLVNSIRSVVERWRQCNLHPLHLMPFLNPVAWKRYGLPKAPALTTSVNNMMSKSQMGASSSTQATNPQEEINQKLRDKLVEQEARAERNYEEMREYKSWLRQIEEGQGSIKGADENMGKFEPVPDNPPGIWDQCDGSVMGKVQLTDRWMGHEDAPTRARKGSRETMAKVSRLGCVAFGNGPCSLCRIWLSWYTSLARLFGSSSEVSSWLRITCRFGRFPISVHWLQAIGRTHFRTWSRTLVRWPRKSKYESGREVRNSGRRATSWWEERSLQWCWITSGLHRRMKHCSMPVISTSYSTVGIRRCIISSTPGWKSSPTWSLRTFVIFKGWEKDDDKKTYKELLNIMKRHIARAREDKNMAARDKFATDYTTLGKPSTPAPKPAAPAPDKVMTRTMVARRTSLLRLIPRPSLRRLRCYHPPTRRTTMARVGSRDQDHLQGIRWRLSVITTSTRATANMVTNVRIAIPNTIGIRRRKQVGKASARAGRQEDHKRQAGRRTGIVMVGLNVNAREEINASSSTTQGWIERKQHLQRQKVTMPRPLLRSSATWTMIAM